MVRLLEVCWFPVAGQAGMLLDALVSLCFTSPPAREGPRGVARKGGKNRGTRKSSTITVA
eukprot:3363008-Rhodomonas_salina.1